MRSAAALPFLLAAISANSDAACDVAGSAQLQFNLARLTSWKKSKNVVEVTWNEFFIEQVLEKARKLIDAFANSDACITRQTREIKFFSSGKVVAIASPDRRIVVADFHHSPTPRNPGKAAPMTLHGKPARIDTSAEEIFANLKNSGMFTQEVKGDPVLAVGCS